MYPPQLQTQLLGQQFANPFSQALSGPAMMDPATMRVMQQQLALRQYDAMMRQPQAAKKKKPPAELEGQLINPFAILSNILGQ